MNIDDWMKQEEYIKKKKRVKANKKLDPLKEFWGKYKGKIIIVVLIFTVLFLGTEGKYIVEVSNIMGYIENREYADAENYYSKLEENLSPSRMDRLNKKVSRKIEKFLVESGDLFISDEISKEEFTGFINMINYFDDVSIDGNRIKKLCGRVADDYASEEIEYKKAISIIEAVSAIDGIESKIEEERHAVESVHKSREMYEKGVEEQKKRQYHTAIDYYNEVLEEDKTYRKNAEKNKKECISKMYDYYINEASSSAKEGSYDVALELVKYVQEYYSEDEKVSKLVDEYSEKASVYMINPEEIIDIYCEASKEDKKGLSVESLPQMVNDEKYYYAEVIKEGETIDEVLIKAEDKKIYTYKDGDRFYDKDYTENYFRVNKSGNIEFGISESDAMNILNNEIKDKGRKYKRIKLITPQRAERYNKSSKGISDMLGDTENTYYYFLGDNGFFKKKDLYCISMYNEKVYVLYNDNFVQF